MMSLSTIRQFSREAAAKAARAHKVPLLVQSEDMGDLSRHLKYMPFLGGYVPKGFEKVQEFFVDSSGFGTEGGSAISLKMLYTQVKVGCAYAVVETGQFQVYIGEFKKTDERGGK